LLEERYGVPVLVANDSHAAALAELTFFRRPRPNNLIVIRVGRGVGAGIILNGQLFQGDGYGAGEFGHVSLGHGGTQCRCGRGGCLETRTSMRALVDAAQAVEPAITDEPRLVAAFGAGVASVRRIVLGAARELGLAIGWLIGVLNVQNVLLVGPVSALGKDFLGEVQRSARSSVLGLLAGDTQIEFGHLQDDVVVLGASALLMEQQLGLGLAR
jgi:predicted NBD/HSP70 family sugar kinase